ncbi:MAG: hypothetical protein Q8K35_02740 [Thiobacillus sp.]|nr:hypothetical protein [Thiobacillus sp.]MDP2056659.1 hypothetical protein [Thiobacillus sp.]
MMKWLALWLLGMGAAHAADMIALRQTMITLRYVDQDPGDPPALTRILVTPDFMRMDGGEDDGDFVLLDRRQRQVTNVTRDNKLAMVFTPGTLPPKPAGWKPRLDAHPAAPGTQRFSLALKDVVCSEGVAARAAAPDAAHAMAELKSVLAAMQYRVWKASPRELQHDCDLANLVWESGATLKLGLPLKEREFTGRTRQLESESKQPMQPELFRVPDGMTAINASS